MWFSKQAKKTTNLYSHAVNSDEKKGIRDLANTDVTQISTTIMKHCNDIQTKQTFISVKTDSGFGQKNKKMLTRTF